MSPCPGVGDARHERHPAEVREEDGGEPDVVLHRVVDTKAPEILKTGSKFYGQRNFKNFKDPRSLVHFLIITTIAARVLTFVAWLSIAGFLTRR